MRRSHAVTGLATLCSVLSFAAAADTLAPGARAPEIGLTSTTGTRIDLAGLHGQVFVVDFWASWCGPCRAELPMLEGLYAAVHARGFTVVGVSQDDSMSAITRFLGRTPVSFPIVQDAGHAVAARYAPPSMPTTFVVDRSGIVRHVHAGYTPATGALIDAEVRALL